MAQPSLLHPSSVTIPPPELHEATILDDAAALGQEVRVEGAWLGSQLASDPMAWEPYMTAAGEFWPRRRDRAVVTAHADGPPVIAWWEPAAGRSPDVASEGAGGFAPFLIQEGETFVVPARKQVLWAVPIEIEAGGSLEVNGMLVEVS